MCVHGGLVLNNTWDTILLSSQCLQCLGSHGHGAATINIHQVLEKEGVLLINYNLLLAGGIDCQIYISIFSVSLSCSL